jgi:DNA processing protein
VGSLSVSKVEGTPSEAEEACAALSLTRVSGLGPRRAKLLIDHFGSAVRAVAACRRGDVGSALTTDRRASATTSDLARRLRGLEPIPASALADLRRRGIRVLVYGAPAYPARLRHLHDPPTLVYVRGCLPLLKASGVAIVGTRRATAYGRRMARDLARGVALRGRTVISGMARGIDGAAHRAALDAGGSSIGVLGCGLERVYPNEHRGLYARMRDEGLLVSEFAPGQAPKPAFFPRRNRIIAALAEAVVVVQAGPRSGALITVGHALDIGREVFAVPGPVGPPASEGVHRLLRDGAGLATSAQDLARGLGWEDDTPVGETTAPGLPDTQEGPAHWSGRLLDRLREGPAGPDELSRVGGRPVVETLAILGRWEVEGRVRRQAGGSFELTTVGAVERHRAGKEGR